MFKKGDKVRRINCNYIYKDNGVCVGEIYTVVRCDRAIESADNRYFNVELVEQGDGWEGFNFELYDDFPELLKKAKEIRRLGEKLL